MGNREALKPYIDELKGHLEDYLKRIVPDYKPGRPFRCLNPTHDDYRPSMAYNRKANKCHCFSCIGNQNFDIINLLAWEYNKDCREPREFVELVFQGCKDFGIAIPADVYNPLKNKYSNNGPLYFARCHADVKNTDYFTKRGLSQDVIERFKLGYDDYYPLGNGKHMKAAIIPTGVESHTARNVSLEADKSDKYRKLGNSRNSFFNIEALDSDGPIFITEGEFDALSIIETGFEAIALGSVANWQSFSEYCKRQNVSQYILIALDNDAAGRITSKKLFNELKSSNIKCIEVNPYMSYKDANEALVRDRESFIMELRTFINTVAESEMKEASFNAILSVLKEYSTDEWNTLGECLLLASELGKADKERVHQFIVNVWSHRKEGKSYYATG